MIPAKAPRIRVAVIGGDDRLHLQDWPDSEMDIETYNGSDSATNNLITSAQKGKVDKVIVLTRWMGHSNYEKLRREMPRIGVPILPWTTGVNNLTKNILWFVQGPPPDALPPDTPPPALPFPLNVSSPNFNLDVSIWETQLVEALTLDRYTLHEIFTWVDVEAGTPQAESVTRALDVLIEKGRLESTDGFYWARERTLSQAEIKETFAAVIELPPPEAESKEEIVPEKKACRICEKEKPLSQFDKHKTHVDGLDHRCKACKAEDYAKRNAARLATLAAKVARRPGRPKKEVEMTEVAGEWMVLEEDGYTRYADKSQALEHIANAAGGSATLWRQVKVRLQTVAVVDEET